MWCGTIPSFFWRWDLVWRLEMFGLAGQFLRDVPRYWKFQIPWAMRMETWKGTRCGSRVRRYVLTNWHLNLCNADGSW